MCDTVSHIGMFGHFLQGNSMSKRHILQLFHAIWQFAVRTHSKNDSGEHMKTIRYVRKLKTASRIFLRWLISAASRLMQIPSWEL